jgi:hypothetical protein
MFLNLTLAFRHTIPIIASGILNPTLAYLPCSRALHMKCRLLPEDLIMSPDIGTNSGKSLTIFDVLPESRIGRQPLLFAKQLLLVYYLQYYTAQRHSMQDALSAMARTK